MTRAGQRERNAWMLALTETPELPWPSATGPWGVSNQQRLMGSPILDAWMNAVRNGWGGEFGGVARERLSERERALAPRVDPEVLEWLLNRPQWTVR